MGQEIEGVFRALETETKETNVQVLALEEVNKGGATELCHRVEAVRGNNYPCLVTTKEIIEEASRVEGNKGLADHSIYQLETPFEVVIVYSLDLMETRLMEDDLLLDGNISLEILALIDGQVRVLEEQILDSGETLGATFQIRSPEEQDDLAELAFESQVMPKTFFIRLLLVANSDMMFVYDNDSSLRSGKLPVCDQLAGT